jgi:hypothetical protein
MDYVLGTAIGCLVAFVFAIPAIVLEVVERWRVQNAPLLVDVKTIFGRKLDRHEQFLVALLLHLVIGSLFGLIYVLFVKQSWLVFTNAPFTIVSLAIYAVCAWIVTGTVIFPALRMGLFGRREGKRVWLEMLVSHFVLGAGLWLVVQYFQPPFFLI